MHSVSSHLPCRSDININHCGPRESHASSSASPQDGASSDAPPHMHSRIRRLAGTCPPPKLKGPNRAWQNGIDIRTRRRRYGWFGPRAAGGVRGLAGRDCGARPGVLSARPPGEALPARRGLVGFHQERVVGSARRLGGTEEETAWWLVGLVFTPDLAASLGGARQRARRGRSRSRARRLRSRRSGPFRRGLGSSWTKKSSGRAP